MSIMNMQPIMPQHSTNDLYAQGKTYLKQGLYEEALVVFDELAKQSPQHPAIHYQRGQALYSLGDIKSAITAYRTSLKYAHHPDTLNTIANSYYALGDREKAMSYYEKSFALHPANPACLFNLVHMNKYELNAPVVKQLLAFHHQPNLTDRDRTTVCFALGEVYEKLGRLKEAFPYFEEGNKHAFAMFPNYVPADDIALMDAIEATFTPKLFADLKEAGSEDATPIFILGMPRSGTSLVEQVLASHSQVVGAGETNAMSILAFAATEHLTGKPFPASINALPPSEFKTFAGQYLTHLRRHTPTSAPHICDKMPTNFLIIGMIHILFPKARIIHCVRDPMDTCWSLYKHLFLDRNPYCYDQMVLGKFFMRYQQLMQYWHRVLPGVVYDIEYEKLVESPEETISALLEHCGLEWEKSCMHFHRTNRPVATASAWQVRRPIYKSSLKLWDPIADELKPLRDALDYK